MDAAIEAASHHLSTGCVVESHAHLAAVGLIRVEVKHDAVAYHVGLQFHPFSIVACNSVNRSGINTGDEHGVVAYRFVNGVLTTLYYNLIGASHRRFALKSERRVGCSKTCIPLEAIHHLARSNSSVGSDGLEDRRTGTVLILILQLLYTVAERYGLHEVATLNLHILGLEQVGQVVAEVRRLIVSHVLPSHAHTINRIVHQSGHTEARLHVGCEDVEVSRVAAVPQYQFLTPVAKDVGQEVGRLLGAVAGVRMVDVVEVLAAYGINACAT